MAGARNQANPTLLLILLLAALLFGPPLRAAYVIFHDGRAYIGEVNRQHDGSFILARAGEPGIQVAPDKVAWFSDAQSAAQAVEEWHGALERMKEAEPGPGWLSLAKFCIGQELLKEAALFAGRWGKTRGLDATATRRFLFLHRPRTDTVKAAASHLEATVDFFLSEFPPAPGAHPGCLVLLVPDESTAHGLGRPSPVAGAVAWHASAFNELVLIDWSRSSVRAMLAELTRVALQYYLRDVHLAGCLVERSWVLDGMASYYKGLVIKAGRPAGVKGLDRELMERIRVNIKAGTYIPLERFLKFRYQDILGGDPYNVYQAQAWSMAWFLLERGRKESGDLLRGFLVRLRELRDEEKAWAETFGRHDPKKLEESWRKTVLAG